MPAIYDDIAIGRMVTIGNFGFVTNNGFKATPGPVVEGMVVPIGCINTFVDLRSIDRYDGVKSYY